MKILTVLAFSLPLSLGGAVTVAIAQTPPEADATAAHNAAIKSPKPMETGSMAKGKNSFTKGEALSRLHKAGYTHVSGLAKNTDGLWQAQAMKDDAKVGVSLDYKGNISSQ